MEDVPGKEDPCKFEGSGARDQRLELSPVRDERTPEDHSGTREEKTRVSHMVNVDVQFEPHGHTQLEPGGEACAGDRAVGSLQRDTVGHGDR